MQDSCPKCNTTKKGESCPTCGLVFAKFDEAVFDEGVPKELVRLWQEVEGNWQERKLHALFVERCLGMGEAGYAAARYRSRGDDAAAEEYLETISLRLTQMMSAVSSPPPRRAGGRLITILILLIVLVGLALLLFTFPELPR
ncbi:MAG: hypothetical protein GY762_23900 [Proteobacteria bacterium]|nr:hypothetical protein [Pseudomonadota bacterium]